MKVTTRTGLGAVVALLVTAVLALPQARASGPCDETSTAGGSWSSYGQDLTNHRNQSAEDTIDAANAGELALEWTTPSTENTGTSTPVVAGRCVYTATSGFVHAWDVASGALVWKAATAGTAQAVAVADGQVHLNLASAAGPRAQAFDANTGAHRWTSETITFGYRADQLASAVLYDGVHLLTTTGPDGDRSARPGYAILDAATGTVLHKQTTIPPEQLDNGYAGGGIWSTAAVDTATGHAYVGTANPYQHEREHAYDNAILKIDLDPDRSTFGTIVGSFKGLPDDLDSGLEDTPVCATLGPYNLPPAASYFGFECGHFDLDFASSPILFEDSAGRQIVAEFQRSGVLFAVDRDTMEEVWRAQVDVPTVTGNGASIAYDGSRIYVAVNHRRLFALDPDTGQTVWTSAHLDEVRYQPVSVANGVVYGISSHYLLGWDAASGTPVLTEDLWTERGLCPGGYSPGSSLAGGVAIARNTVIGNCDGALVAYRLGGAS